jgi:hypothetical protein
MLSSIHVWNREESRNSVFYLITITFLSLSHNISILVCLYRGDISPILAVRSILQINGYDLRGTEEHPCVEGSRFQVGCAIFKQGGFQTRTNTLSWIRIKEFDWPNFLHYFLNISRTIYIVVIKPFMYSLLHIYIYISTSTPKFCTITSVVRSIFIIRDEGGGGQVRLSFPPLHRRLEGWVARRQPARIWTWEQRN